MASIINYLKNNQKACLAASLTLLGGYLLFRNQSGRTRTEEKKNILEVTLKELIHRDRHKQVKKIVITSSGKTKGTFRRNLVSYIKTRLIEQNIKVLINCSPQKLLQSGCQCYIESMQKNDSDFDNYYLNALKAQFLIQDTIISIETINQRPEGDLIVMICDNNPMDIRMMNQSDQIWTETLAKNDLDQKQIRLCYDIIIHAIEQEGPDAEDQRIQEIWKCHPSYYPIEAQEGKLREKHQEVFGMITKYLESQKQKLITH